MNHSSHRYRGGAPLTAKLGELAGPLPDVQLAPANNSAAKRNGSRRASRRRRNDQTPLSVLASIARDAAGLKGDAATATLVSVPPADPGDSTVLFLRSGNETRLVLAVPPEVIRSTRLRGDRRRRDREAEHQYEMLRLADSRALDGHDL